MLSTDICKKKRKHAFYKGIERSFSIKTETEPKCN